LSDSPDATDADAAEADAKAANAAVLALDFFFLLDRFFLGI
jgi:hypothetical protein